jgi:hypothetical protein
MVEYLRCPVEDNEAEEEAIYDYFQPVTEFIGKDFKVR